ncbi:GNAT family N-acetyltransferase [Paenibacillus sp. DMB20]|uniref:GNAT family N-acetyltransferase n=1 Tax=Paenibacillus sp. DMB20 TaxID=1642570 RepID=UPI000627C100|nr:GNAT family N-acetyltransferase [Paenibacillus sp. DMB20]KKO54460.1 GNAT family acetyltransferase [Paenibacillus sp. DMB20]
MIKDISYRLDDLEVKELLAYAVFPDPESLETAVEAYRKPNGLELYGYEEEDVLVGLIGVDLTDKEMTIKHIAVTPENRGKDYGRGMIMELMLQKKPDVVIAETDEESVGFYRSIGFQIYSLGERFPGVERFRCVYEVEEEES